MPAIRTPQVAEPKRITRRELLGYAWLASLAALIGFGMRAVLRFASPPARPGEYGGVIEMGVASELPPAGSTPLNHPEGRFWLVSTDEGYLALSKACTHLDCLCDWDEQTRSFVCPCHGSRFAEDGAYLEGPATRSLDRYVVQVVEPDGKIVAETDPAAASAVSAGAAAKGSAGVAVASGVDLGAESEDEPEEPGYAIRVDTGRKVPGAPATQG